MDDFFHEIKEEGKLKRARNREMSTQLLKENGIEFRPSNNGSHLIIDHVDNNLPKSVDSGTIDFWPGTGVFVVRNKYKTRGRGIFKLLKRLGIDARKQKTKTKT